MAIRITSSNYGGRVSISSRGLGGRFSYVADPPPQIVTSGLVLNLDAGNTLSYPGTGTLWSDLSGNGNNGTLVNGPTYTSANGGSIIFDGTNDYAVFNNPSTIRNQNFTVSIWFNPGTQNASIISIIDFDHVSSQGWVMQSEDATINRYYYFAWYDGSQFQPTSGGGFGAGKGIQITTSAWQNITYSKNGTTLLGYKNGSQVYSGTASNGNVFYLNNKNMQIAAQSLSRNFNASIPNTLIYNRSLSAEEILQNYNARKTRFGL